MLRRLSLIRRLTLFFTLVAASVVLGLGGLFMTAADRHFIELDRSVLQDKRHLIDDILASANSAEDLSLAALRSAQPSSQAVRTGDHSDRPGPVSDRGLSGTGSLAVA
jgi:hypothetical protein